MRLALLLLAAGCALPDTVTVSPSVGQHSYLGSGDAAWPLADKTSDDYGLRVDVTWHIKAREMRIVDFGWDRPPDRLAELLIGKPLPPIVDVHVPEAPKEDGVGDTVAKVAGATKNMTGGELAFWSFLAVLVLLALMAIGPKIADHYLAKKAKKDTP